MLINLPIDYLYVNVTLISDFEDEDNLYNTLLTSDKAESLILNNIVYKNIIRYFSAKVELNNYMCIKPYINR